MDTYYLDIKSTYSSATLQMTLYSQDGHILLIWIYYILKIDIYHEDSFNLDDGLGTVIGLGVRII
jgi:hypothetical protein